MAEGKCLKSEACVSRLTDLTDETDLTDNYAKLKDSEER